MISREAIDREIDRIEGRLKVLETSVGRPGVSGNDFRNEIIKVQELLSNLRSMIAREPLSGHEMNVQARTNQ
jgi:hypothetical protein